MAKGFKTGGRQAGTENKVTNEIKEAYRSLIEMNLVNMTVWLEKVAEKNPEKALSLLISISEYIIPKLARTEVKGALKSPDVQVFQIGDRIIRFE